jgi:1-acyl-sn-glycerol-3-phosphate acyltransferase
VILTVAIPVWLPLVLVIDACRLKWRFPLARLLSFAVCWVWLETSGVICSALLWITGQSKNLPKHYALQRWWADQLLRALKATCGFSVEVENIDALQPGPVLLFARHASLADSLVSAYVVTTLAQMNPRYVLKRELLADPCLDVVGQRLPNHFLDRQANDSTPELLALEELVTGIDESTVGIIFPEGTRANKKKRDRALEKIAVVDAERAQRLQGMKHLLPPRPAGAAAMLRGCPSADVVFAWHVGFEGLDTFGGILRGISSRMPPIRFHLRRVERLAVPLTSQVDTNEMTKWLDSEWMRMDHEVDEALILRNKVK